MSTTYDSTALTLLNAPKNYFADISVQSKSRLIELPCVHCVTAQSIKYS